MAIVAMGELGAVPGVAADALVRAMMGADICVRTESLNRTYERPALRVRSPTSKRLSVAVPRRRAPSLANSNSGARGQRYIERRRWRSAHSYTSCIGTEPHPAKASGSNSARTAYILAPEFAPRTVCASRGTVKINRTSREPHMTRGRTMRNLGARARRGLLPARAFPYSAAIQMLGCASFNCEPEQLSYAS